MPNPLVTVEPVEASTQLRRFRDIPFLLHGEDDRWRPGVRSYESWRLDAKRHPYFDVGDAAYFLARRGGTPVGRIAAHLAEAGRADGRFGFFDAPDDDEVVAALLDAAQEWLTGEGVTSMTGPESWWPDEEFGVRVDGHDHPAITGRPWQPAWYGEVLTRAGLAPGEVRRTFRLATDGAAIPAPAPADVDPPPHAGGYSDARLVLDGIAAVPDVSATLASASMRSAWRVARTARRKGFDTAVCVRCTGDPAVLVPRLRAAAKRAGYRWLIAPWGPPGTPPETAQQVFSRRWSPADEPPPSARR